MEKQIEDVNDGLKGCYFACTHQNMLTEDELEDYELTQSAGDVFVTYKNQHVPPHYKHLMKDKNLLKNEL